MSNSIFYCNHCKNYTMEISCPKCNSTTYSLKPAKFSLEDRWGKWRREYKKEQQSL